MGTSTISIPIIIVNPSIPNTRPPKYGGDAAGSTRSRHSAGGADGTATTTSGHGTTRGHGSRRHDSERQ